MGKRVRIVNAKGERRWHPIWDGNPNIVRPEERGPFELLVNASGSRPYIAAKEQHKWTWREFECTPADIYLTDVEKAYGRLHDPGIVIEPWTKPEASPNKQWGQWRAFVELAKGHKLTQLGSRGTAILPGVKWIRTDDFRLACAVLARAKLYIGPDGGLMHAAAALGVPAVVIRGAFISERVTGYQQHKNLFTGEGLGCGSRTPCPCCKQAMARITPHMVLDALKEFV